MTTYILGDNEPTTIDLAVAGVAIALTGALVDVVAKPRSGVGGAVTRHATLSATKGRVTVAWHLAPGAGESGTLAVGGYDLAVVCTFASGDVRTYPSERPWPVLDVIARPA